MHKQLILSTPAYTRSIHSCVRQRPSTTNPTSATLLTRPNRRDSDLRISQTTTNALSHQLTRRRHTKMAVLKPKLSRKVLTSAGVAAFVLGNRSRVEILDVRTRA